MPFAMIRFPRRGAVLLTEVINMVLNAALLCCLSACTPRQTPVEKASGVIEPASAPSPVVDAPVPDPREPFLKEAAKIAAALSDSRLASHCLLAGLDNQPVLSQPVAALFREIPPGGIMLFKYNLSGGKEETASLISGYTTLITDAGGIPPFAAVDHEGGLVHRFGPGVARLPAPSSFWDLARREGEGAALASLERLARLSGAELKGMGINLNLAPVAEVLDNGNKAFLDTRSFGPDPDFVEKAASAFIRGMDAAGIACTVKHFPGNSAADPHAEISRIRGGMDHLNAMVLPFAGIIGNTRVPAVMVSHVIVEAVDPRNNASLSREVISLWLRGELGFKGFVLSDDFSMQAVTARGISVEDAVVDALNAGVDMVMCWPSNMAAIHKAILAALDENRLSRERLVDAATNILAEKLRYKVVASGK